LLSEFAARSATISPVPDAAPKQFYSREEVRRLLSVSERQLRAWEEQRLCPRCDQYAFPDLIALRTLAKLRKQKIPTAQIRKAMAAVREKLTGVDNPLTELKVFADGAKIRVQVAGQTMEPVSGQLLFNFDSEELSQLFSFPAKNGGQREDRKRIEESERLFQHGIELEQQGAPLAEILAAYQEAARLDPRSPSPLINLGTLYFHAKSWTKAEQYYRQALTIAPDHALAHFNLANLYDERGRREDAFRHYRRALELHPNYADAHYNLALLYQTAGDTLKAVRHWKAYLKLDASSSWADVARRELDKLFRATVVPGRGGHR
jgi:tetratricopeptide (TPR) repeat protein